MQIRFSPFKRKEEGPADDIHRIPIQPVPSKLVTKTIRKPKPDRKVSIVHPEQAGAYRLKSQLLADGHRRVETFFLPESLLAVVKQGHAPDVVFIHDFVSEEAGMTGVELARTLRNNHQYKGLLYSTSDDHANVSPATLELHGFSGHADAYLAR